MTGRIREVQRQLEAVREVRGNALKRLIAVLQGDRPPRGLLPRYAQPSERISLQQRRRIVPLLLGRPI